jgi:hypothetical protein
MSKFSFLPLKMNLYRYMLQRSSSKAIYVFSTIMLSLRGNIYVVIFAFRLVEPGNYILLIVLLNFLTKTPFRTRPLLILT